jgi:hypothetical protein
MKHVNVLSLVISNFTFLGECRIQKMIQSIKYNFFPQNTLNFFFFHVHFDFNNMY